MIFEMYYDEYYDKIYAYITRRINNRTDAEDLTAEVFLKAFANPYNPELAKFSTYVYKIASNELKNYFAASEKRKKIVDIAECEISDEYDVLKDLITREEHGALLEALTKLPQKQYDVVYGRYYLEQSYKEIGAAAGVTEAYARKLHERALDSLKNLI